MSDILDDDATDDRFCTTCKGTGIGQHGDPDTSRCHVCHGTGRSASATQEQREYEDEVRRDMKIDDQLTKEG